MVVGGMRENQCLQSLAVRTRGKMPDSAIHPLSANREEYGDSLRLGPAVVVRNLSI